MPNGVSVCLSVAVPQRRHEARRREGEKEGGGDFLSEKKSYRAKSGNKNPQTKNEEEEEDAGTRDP
jgi:hypothetical protein